MKWKNDIENGFVSIDSETNTNPESVLREDEVIEYTDYKHHMQTQTESNAEDSADAASNYDYKSDDFEEGKGQDKKKKASFDSKSLSSFLAKVMPSIEKVIDSNSSSMAFEGYELIEVLLIYNN